MSKGLDALQDIKQLLSLNQYGGDKDKQVVNDELYIIEKELKALEILRAFDFEIEDYTEELNGSVVAKFKRIILDNEEIDLLKEVL